MVPDEKVEMVPRSRAERILAVVLPLISLFLRGGHHRSSSATEFYFSIQRYERIFVTEGYKTL
jgi:hypothetical protein